MKATILSKNGYVLEVEVLSDNLSGDPDEDVRVYLHANRLASGKDTLTALAKAEELINKFDIQE